MEPASIGQEVKTQQAPVSLVTEDDLQLEIGRWVVASLNKDKMLKLAVGQINVLTARVQEQEAKINERDALKKSNELFSGKNGKLADDLRDVRAELVKVNDENVAISKAVRDEHAVAIGAKDLEIERLNARHDRLLKKRGKKV